MIDALESVDRRVREVWHGAGEPAEQDHALLVGNRRHGFDDIHGRRLAQQLLEARASVAASQSSERARCRARHRPIAIFEETYQEGYDLRGAAGAAAGGGPNARIGVLQQRTEHAGGQGRVHRGGRVDRDPQRRALYDRPGNQPGDDLPGFVTANFAKGAKRRRLFGHQAVRAESLKASAQRREGGDGSGKPPPPGFRSEQSSVREARFRDGGDQRRVVLVGR